MNVIYARADSSSCRRKSLLRPTTEQSGDEGCGGMIASKNDDIHCAETSDVQGRFDALRSIILDQDLVDTIYKDDKISIRFEDQSVEHFEQKDFTKDVAGW